MHDAALWQVNMGDGTWSVCCMTCRLPLYRGDKTTADQIFDGHICQREEVTT
jgi:hypothetical protein